MIVKTIRLSVGPKSTQEGDRLLLDVFRLDSLRRSYGETMRHWTRRFTLELQNLSGIEHLKFRDQQRLHSTYLAG